MDEHQIQKMIDESSLSNRTYIDKRIEEHDHTGTLTQRISSYDLNDSVDISLNVISPTIATAAANYDVYFLVPTCFLTATIKTINFSGLEALATSDTNYITFTFTNLGQAGAGSTVILGTETTKITGGTAIVANTKKTFNLTTEPKDLNIEAGDRIRIRATVTGTLANVVQYPVYLIEFTQ
jgi:hypothetical protein